ncbi:hypothetical protein PHYBLDRAFT_173800 [Phycomyces blakesleeanus NRRL 1555(-)]|uniref:Uncharacterized protein n=1 Tax=Phycomyces blakesleeanus (strain ATCC 8743b / DSM 1359 / FGSC 10004 / NBRC 33097 / NRRL 1555) TaxID=763407 RepID=A0A162N2R1_PHYB8|nr:hypothetical protein PHYBLDRAFT_173800 [Phycomyces blakesleeanus NRRL 1555(-)]OAD67888.1 hypothetical protein PHYBLDRAFT_173800 [Phycomyces blakesleeanus NRRL 1555(-)]|eukprot:XP_018285928.1 hypothetical protein PHYBLDRAFT_173800 [Phycomyces blakesleeanus NRRL 1555(-)]
MSTKPVADKSTTDQDKKPENPSDIDEYPRQDQASEGSTTLVRECYIIHSNFCKQCGIDVFQFCHESWYYIKNGTCNVCISQITGFFSESPLSVLYNLSYR